MTLRRKSAGAILVITLVIVRGAVRSDSANYITIAFDFGCCLGDVVVGVERFAVEVNALPPNFTDS